MQGAFQPNTAGTRATALSIILAIHGVAIAAIVSMGAIQVVIREQQPVQARLLPAPERHIEIPRPVALPNFRPPEIRLPSPPPIESLFTLRTEESAPHSAPAPVALQVASVAPSPAPVIEPPRADIAYLNNPAPAYPSASKRIGEQGRVTLRVRVDERGNVEMIEVQATSGFPRLDDAALAAVRRWRFVPARMGERAVAGWALVPINFTLRG